MRNLLVIALAVFALAYTTSAQSQPGTLAVLRVGDGVNPLSSSGNALFLQQYTTNGTLVNTVAIPSSGANALIVSGKATSEGFISRSEDTHLITLAGYNTNLTYTGSISSSDSKAVPRAVATVDYLGNYAFITNTTVFFTSNNMRSATTDGASNFWGAGAASGTVYLGLLYPTNIVQSANTEVVSIFNGDLYFSSQKTPSIGIYGYTNTPTTTTAATLLLASSGPSSPSPYAFAISPDGQTVYLADDNTLAKQGGIQKYVNSSGTWNLAYVLGAGSGLTQGDRGVAVDFSGANPIVYATTADAASNYIIKMIDNGSSSQATILATAGTNEIFRGIQFAAQGSPPQITAEPLDQGATNGQNIIFSVTATGTPTLAYQWQFNSNAIALATNATLTLTNVTTNNVGSYKVVITNSWGAITSTPAILVFGGPPPPQIFTQPQSVTTNAGSTVTFSVTASQDASSYQWQENGANISGSTSNLTLTDVLAANTGSYRVIISNSYAATTSSVAVLTVNDPYITVQPIGQTYLAGSNATLSVQAIGTAPFAYQWSLNGSPLSGATSNILSLTNLQPSQSGTYSVLVSGPGGSAHSSNAIVLVAAPQTTFFGSNLVVLRQGDGAETLSHSGNTLFLDQFTTNGAYASTMKLPDSGSNALLISGVASSEGYMTLSARSNLLVVAGYNTNIGSYSGSLSASTSSVIPRAIGTINGAGVYTLAVSSTNAYSTNNLRSATSDDNDNFWGAGSDDGIYYFGLTAPAAAIETNYSDCRVINTLDGSYLAFSTQSTTPGIYLCGSFPVVATTPSLIISTGASSSPEDFIFAPDNTVAYVADDSASGGIQRWTLNSGQWQLAYTLGSGAASIGVRSLTVNFSGAYPVIYGVTAEASGNRVITVVDNGASAGTTTLATAPTNELYRAIRVSPVLNPLPATLTALLTGITLTGTADYTYVLETSTNLLNWTPLETNVAPFSWTNSGSSNVPARFYRAVSQP